jgi:transcriptional regulator with GAF, ATPase, and Fis domain
VIKTNAAAAEIEPLVAKMEQSASIDVELLNTIASKIAHAFSVADDEVAVLGVIAKGKLLKFIIPEKLRTIGTIPLNSTGALAAKTAREKRGEISNNFANSRHASVFEAVPMGRNPGETIQKIMSVPILFESKTIGVLQISRKARSQEESGVDFRSDDLRKLQNMAAALVKFVQVAMKA